MTIGTTKLAVGIWLVTFAAASAGLPRLLSYQAKNQEEDAVFHPTPVPANLSPRGYLVHEAWRGGRSPRQVRHRDLSANTLMAKIHDRMPVILLPRAGDRWLDPTADEVELHRLLVPLPAKN
jgi:hypothetical protein